MSNVESAEEIIKRIIKHKSVYELSAEEIPPYRLLYGEHEILMKWWKENKFISNDWGRGLVKEYMGVKIEVVALIGK